MHRSRDRQGNVFTDLGLRDAQKLKIDSGLVIEITRAIRKLNLAQKEGRRRMGIPQPKVSAMLCGDFSNQSDRKQKECLNRLVYDIEIKVRPTKEPMGHLTLGDRRGPVSDENPGSIRRRNQQHL